MTFSILLIVLLPVAMLFVLLLFVIATRYLRYKERIALAQLGYSLEELNREDATASRGNRGIACLHPSHAVCRSSTAI